MVLGRGRRRRLAEAAESPGPDEQEEAIVAALEGLRTRTAREVMTPRVDVVALKAPVAPDDVARAVKESGHSRFPVYEEDLDSLLGVLYVKDLFRISGVATVDDIARRLRKPHMVPEHRRALDVLAQMRRERAGFAIVVDEYGGVEGVLTMKDLVSEIVGELPDEHDRLTEEELTPIDATRWLAAGTCPVDRLQTELLAPIPEGEYVTLGGFLFDRFGRIPADGDRLLHEGWEYRVEEMDRRRIARVVVRAPSATIAGSTAAAADR